MTIGVRSASNRPGYQRDAQGMQDCADVFVVRISYGLAFKRRDPKRRLAAPCGLQASARDQAAGVLCCAHVLRAELCSALLLHFATQNTPPS